jgi:hypothetical protein
MLQTFVTGIYMSVDQAQHYDQRPFRSMLVQGWIAYRSGRGFHITPEGRRAFDVFHRDPQEKPAHASDAILRPHSVWAEDVRTEAREKTPPSGSLKVMPAYLAQLKCPSNHCVIGAAGVYADDVSAAQLECDLQEAFDKATAEHLLARSSP